MEREYLIRQTMKLFTEIATKLISSSFKFSKGGAAYNTVAKALDGVEKKYGSLTKERVVDYCVSAAYPFRERGSDWKINQVFGPKSIERLNSDKGLRYYQDKWLARANITRSHLVSYLVDKSEHPQAQYEYLPMEEPTKSRMLNTHAGYLICQTSTLGWSPESESCSQCNYTEECKIETQKKFPEIFRLRIEHGIKERK